MENRVRTALSFWAMGLLLFVSTMIIIRWVVEFVTWSTLDSGWTQAIGSISALAVAIFVMSRQNAHAAQLIIKADRLAAKRRTAAVKAIAHRATTVAGGIRPLVDLPIGVAVEQGRYLDDLRAASSSLQGVIASVNAVPAHELGSYDMAEGIHLLAVNLDSLRRIIARLTENPGERATPDAAEVFEVCFGYIQKSIEQFDHGAAEFD